MIPHTVAVVNPLEFIGWIYWAKLGHFGLRYNQDYLQSFLWDLVLNGMKWPIENVHQCGCVTIFLIRGGLIGKEP